MKRISFFLAAALLSAPAISNAQDAATQEQLNKLSGQIENLIEMQAAQAKRIDAIAKDLQNVQQAQANKPVVDYATQDELKQLAAKIKEVDGKRQDDNERVLEELKKLGSTLKATATKHTAPAPVSTGDDTTATTSKIPDKGFEYKVQAGDTLGAIVKAYQEKNIKVTIKQILEANPGLKPEKMYVGQKIFIPAPQQ
jgi:LysM repeat protein